MALLTALLLALTLTATTASAQTCYYPDGTPTDIDAPCPNSAQCCPLNWQCLSNGLCYDPTNDYFERRTCTDVTWESTDCPAFCTYSAGGNEAILQCANEGGKYCCDGDRVSFDCCDGTLPPGTGYFALPDGSVVGSITEMGPPAATSSPAGRSSSSSSEEETVTTSSSSSSSSTPAATTSVRSSTTSAPESAKTSKDSSSSVTSVTSTASNDTVFTFATGTSDADSKSSGDGSFSSGAIIGLAIGVSVLLIVCAVMAWLLYRRHKKSKIPRMATYHHEPVSPTEMKRYSDAIPPALSSRALGPESSPKAYTDSTSELYGSDYHQMRNSGISSMTAGAQGYSPTSMVSPMVSSGGASPYAAAGGRMDQIEEKDEPPPVELWGGPVARPVSKPVVYRPYRPGLENSGQGAQGQEQAPDFGDARPYEGT